MRQLSLLLFTLFITTLTSTATELPRTGWNLIAVCQDIEHSELDMGNIAEIQAQDGRSIYTGVYASYSNLDRLEAGYGYWVRGVQGVQFDSGEAKIDWRFRFSEQSGISWYRAKISIDPISI